MIAVPQPKALIMSSAARSSRYIICSLLVAGAVAVGSGATAAPPPPPATTPAAATFVDLGSAASYSVLAGTSVANTGPGTVLAGDLGLSPTGPISGFPPGTVNGTIHDKDDAAEAAQSDRAEAYADAAAQETTTTFTGDQAGVTFHPGVHTTAAAFSNTGTVTLDADGDSNAVFIFQVNAALSSAAGSKVVLADGALANNVFWQVAGAISLAADAKSVGTFLGAGAIAFGDGASLKGRALTPTSVAMTNTPFLVAIDDLTAPLISIDGDAARSTNDTTPAISGTTDEPAGTVRVTVSGQTLTAPVGAGGIWTVSSNRLGSGTHTVVATITDPSHNVGTAEQELTVDQTAPVISINGPATRATNDTTPAISGTTDAAPGTPVTVTVDGQTLTTEATGETGAWTVTAETLAEDVHSAVASIEDGAGNKAIATQILVVDLTVPVVTITGGATRSTDDTSPWTYGTTAEKAGTTVHLTVGSQHLTATVEPGGAWGVSAATLAGGTHTVVASVTDAAQNTGTATQALTIDVPGDPAPGIIAISPSRGPLTGNTQVMITGTGFTGATKVTFGWNGDATSFTVVNDSHITATSPSSAAIRTLNIRVTTPVGGISPIVAGDRFSWVVSPAITAVAPASGPVSGGTEVMITGTGFNNATKVRFGLAGNATIFTVVSDTQIRATSPASGTGAGRSLNITVTTPGGTSPVVTADRFTWQ